MRSIIFAAALVACGGAFALPASAVPTSGARGVVESQSVVVQAHDDSRYCRRLRRACEFKYERGEVGEGNCRRYRRECGR
jgi:hypothetical protein